MTRSRKEIVIASFFFAFFLGENLLYDNDEFKIKSSQPYIVLTTEQFTQHMQDSKGIAQFYEFHGNKESNTSVELIADTCTNIIFSYNMSGSACYKAYVIGSNLEKINIEIEKDSVYFGIKFQPGENPCFKHNIVKTFVQKQTDLQNFPHMKKVLDQLETKDSFEKRIEAFLDIHENYYNTEVSFKHKLYRQFIRLIVSKKGILKISELVELTGYSARYINQIFEDVSGMSAKQFCNNVKLQHVIDDMNNLNIETLSKLVTDYRFYDMAHFIHEFKAFSGKTPGEYLTFVRENDYSSHLTTI